MTIFERSLDLFLKLMFRVIGKLALQKVVLLLEDSFLKFYWTKYVLNDRLLVLCLFEPNVALSNYVRLRNS